jgi:hypothetical protein
MSNVQILNFAHYINEGVRGATGGAPQNDKVWGIAKIDNKLVNFWGRRNGKLKFKTRFLTELPVVLAKYEEKIGARTDGGDVYTPVVSPRMADMLCPTLKADITKHFYTSMAKGTLNTKH